MVDENDPIVRAVAAPFEASMGEFRRGIDDANARFSDDMRTIEQKISEREEKLKEQQEAGTSPAVRELLDKAKAEHERPKTPEWDYDNPLPGQQPPGPSWPATTPHAAPGPAAPPHPYAAPVAAHRPPEPEPSWDYGDPLSAGNPPPRRAWPGEVSAPPTDSVAAQVVEPPAAPSPPRRSRPARQPGPPDDDYSGESWLQ